MVNFFAAPRNLFLGLVMIDRNENLTQLKVEWSPNLKRQIKLSDETDKICPFSNLLHGWKQKDVLQVFRLILAFKLIFWRGLFGPGLHFRSQNKSTLHNVSAIHWRGCSTLGGHHEYSEGYCEYTRGCSIHQGNIVSTPGAYHDECRGISWVHWEMFSRIII